MVRIQGRGVAGTVAAKVRHLFGLCKDFGRKMDKVSAKKQVYLIKLKFPTPYEWSKYLFFNISHVKQTYHSLLMPRQVRCMSYGIVVQPSKIQLGLFAYY